MKDKFCVAFIFSISMISMLLILVLLFPQLFAAAGEVTGFARGLGASLISCLTSLLAVFKYSKSSSVDNKITFREELQMKKYIPNFLSCIRIFGALMLIIFFNDFSAAFLVIYALSASTDALDGYFARKFDVCSVLGVALDTIGDALIGFAPIKILIVQRAVSDWLVVWALMSVAMFFTSAVIPLVKFRKFSFPHTYFDKLLGVVTALLPFAVQLIETDTYLTFFAIMFFIAAVESLIIEIRLKEAKPFVASVFHTDK